LALPVTAVAGPAAAAGTAAALGDGEGTGAGAGGAAVTAAAAAAAAFAGDTPAATDNGAEAGATGEDVWLSAAVAATAAIAGTGAMGEAGSFGDRGDRGVASALSAAAAGLGCTGDGERAGEDATLGLGDGTRDVGLEAGREDIGLGSDGTGETARASGEGGRFLSAELLRRRDREVERPCVGDEGGVMFMFSGSASELLAARSVGAVMAGTRSKSASEARCSAASSGNSSDCCLVTNLGCGSSNMSSSMFGCDSSAGAPTAARAAGPVLRRQRKRRVSPAGPEARAGTAAGCARADGTGPTRLTYLTGFAQEPQKVTPSMVKNAAVSSQLSQRAGADAIEPSWPLEVQINVATLTCLIRLLEIVVRCFMTRMKSKHAQESK
jgi:hypothetical protein